MNLHPADEYDNFTAYFKNEHVYRINASIVKHEKKIYCAYRSQHLYDYNAHSYLVELNADLEIANLKRLNASNNNPAFEDVRLFSVGKLLIAFYTYLPFTEGKWVWEYSVGFGIVDVDNGIIKHQISLKHLKLQPQSKNWVPFFYKNELFLITDFTPFLRVIKVSNNSGNLVLQQDYLAIKKTESWEYGEIRGGTPLISPPKSKSNWKYGFVHSHLTNYNGYARYYFYTVVRYNAQTQRMQYYKQPLDGANNEIDEKLRNLWLQSTNGEFKVVFPIGIMNYKDGVLISLGIDDIFSTVKYFKWDYLIGLFKRLN